VKYALLLDGGFVCKRLYRKLGKKHATAQNILDECTRIRSHDALSDGQLLRIYYYDAPPATGQLTNPISGKTSNLGQSPIFSRATSIHDKLELSTDFALRLGELVQRGWKFKERALKQIAKKARNVKASDLEPNFKQKGVDLRIGLDIARLSLGALVDVIVVVTGDSDLVPAFKFARREGVRVYLDHLGAPVMRDLKAHTDLIL